MCARYSVFRALNWYERYAHHVTCLSLRWRATFGVTLHRDDDMFNYVQHVACYATLRDATHAIVMLCIVDKQRRHATLTRMHDGAIGYNPTPVIDR